ncbi:Sterile alpha motif domain-containing protein 15 [Papilio xuthus]|uniref:Sterile alpha motif domain-containing protein 15 n=1 Tax=Papilio xuthus TaxID=66420 RepID=A0A194Q4V0_PAPXU|nr:Sterile alpha motif domain-containing protein 15 [Papilio xuthus]
MGEIKQKGEQKIKSKRKIIIPHRQPSIVIPERVPIYVTPDKTTCVECGCFPKDPYVKNKKLLPCLKSPLTLYELSAKVVDDLHFPDAFTWTAVNVADWISDIGLPQYRECILVNDINGLRLLMLEDPSKLPLMNIRDFEHIKIITSKVRQLYSTEFIRFARSIGLPPRKPLTHCTWFKSRTGPSWGIRKNWTRYQKPDFPKVKFGRVHIPRRITYIPHYIPKSEKTTERLVSLNRGFTRLGFNSGRAHFNMFARIVLAQ